MIINNNITPYLYRIEDIQWGELEAINIYREELIRDGHMEKLLSGEKTDIIHVDLMMLGISVTMDATLQVIEQDGKPVLDIVGITPVHNPTI